MDGSGPIPTGRNAQIAVIHGPCGELVKSTDFVEKVACRGDALLIHFSQ
jgi:hypothetical protein